MTVDTTLFTKLVASCIPSWPDEPRTSQDIADELGAKKSRVDKAIARMRDSHPDLPLTNAGEGYRWSAETDDVSRHARRTVRYVSTRTRRTLLDGLLEPYYANDGADSARVERARMRIQFILEDLAEAMGL